MFSLVYTHVKLRIIVFVRMSPSYLHREQVLFHVARQIACFYSSPERTNQTLALSRYLKATVGSTARLERKG